jgi:solute:Na+ symporter, SSS family
VALVLSLFNLLIEGNLIERCFKLVNWLTAPLFVLFFLASLVAERAWAGLLASVATAIAIAYAKDLNLPISISFVWMMPVLCS